MKRILIAAAMSLEEATDGTVQLIKISCGKFPTELRRNASGSWVRIRAVQCGRGRYSSGCY